METKVEVTHMNNNIHIIAAAIALCSCSASPQKEAVAYSDSTTDINGEWYVTEVDSTVVDTTKTMFRPTIYFKAAVDSIAGCASCNSFCGKADIDTVKQTIRISELAQTLLGCESIEYEYRIFSALDKVRAYKGVGKECIELTDSVGKTVMQLKKQ